jgi:uridine kinase
MSADTNPRLEVLRELRDEVLHNYGAGRPLIAVDGIDGAGTTAFADDLAAVFAEVGHSAERADVDDFRSTDGAASLESHGLDEAAFRSALVVPFRAGGDTRYRTSAATGADERTAPADTVLIVAGPFLHRPGLVGLWNYSVFLEVPSQSAPDDHRRYLAEVRPRTRAVAIVDNAEPDRPVRRFADSC